MRASYLNRMNSHWHHMMESLFNSKSWQQLDTEQLKRMTLEYPYFPITQFMYARKLKLDHHSAYPEQAAKTAIFFTNPYWLNWQMNLDKYVEEPVPVSSAPIIDEEIRESFIDNIERDHDQHVTPEVTPEDFESVDTVIENSSEEMSEPVNLPEAESGKVEVTPAVEESLIPIEPLFATDYFASQGIKLSEAEETSDRLGQKLKSFTEWLKMMKRHKPKETEVGSNDIYDQKIQRIAESSNESREVLTETMAEVLLLQGLRDKAIEVYQKLSLLNPEKSAYFAAKIEEIKVV